VAWINETIRTYLPAMVLPEDGRCKRIDSDDLWIDMVLAICYIGASNPGERFRDGRDIQLFRIGNVGSRQAQRVTDVEAPFIVVV
jgi:hypothetical protein